MKKILLTFCAVILMLPASAVTINERCERIISLSPTITDTLLSLGLEKHLVGGTRYDRLPENSTIQQIGGMLDPNYEAITMLSPTIILSELTEDSPQKRKLDNLKLNNELLKFTSLDEVKESLIELGKICGIENIAEQKLTELTTNLDILKVTSPAPRVLMLYTYEGENPTGEIPQRAAGKSFHEDILHSIGARNAYEGSLNAPLMSPEGLLMLDPDVILLLQGDQTKTLDSSRVISIEAFQPNWRNLQGLSAIKNNKVYLLKGESTFISSPDAVIATLKSFYSALSQ